MIQVYHYSYDYDEDGHQADDIWSISRGDVNTVKRAWEGKAPDIAYLPVALVDTDNLETAFMLTNHIDESWTLNDGVDALLTKVRSTSVGDVMVRGDKRFLVDRMGFTELK